MAAGSIRKQDDELDDETPDGLVPEDGISLRSARVSLGDLVIRAGMLDERIVITRNGKRTAAIVGMKDLERLVALDSAAA